MKDTVSTKSVRASVAAGIAMGAAAVTCDRLWRWFREKNQKHAEALSDGAAHIATALAVALPAAPFVSNPARFVRTTALSAVLIDLDHLVAARSVALIPCMSMPSRPPSHSAITLGAVTYLAERTWPGSQTELAITLGLGSHLLRDLSTGGAPLFIPRRIVAVARHHSIAMLVGLAVLGRWHARRTLDPTRRRRSNPAVLAPEMLIAGSRAMRARRVARHAA